MTFHAKLMAAVASAGMLIVSSPAFAASPAAMASAAPKSTPCRSASGKYTKCSAMPAGVTKDKNGKCHGTGGKYVTCPGASPSAMKASPSAMKASPSAMKASPAAK